MQKDQRGREHEEQQSLLYLSLYHMPAPTLAQHQSFSNTVAWSSREHILKELLIKSALGLLNRVPVVVFKGFLYKGFFFFPGYHRSGIGKRKPQTGNLSNSAGNLTHQCLKKHSNTGFLLLKLIT